MAHENKFRIKVWDEEDVKVVDMKALPVEDIHRALNKIGRKYQ